MVSILMISAKLATPDLPKIKIFQSKGYDVIILDYDVTHKILLLDLNYIVDVVMRLKFCNSSSSIGYHNLNFIRI